MNFTYKISTACRKIINQIVTLRLAQVRIVSSQIVSWIRLNLSPVDLIKMIYGDHQSNQNVKLLGLQKLSHNL
jgi:hypothetical protein